MRIAEAGASAFDVALLEDVERIVHDQAGENDGDQLDDLDVARRAAENVPGFEILHQFAGYGRGYANHGGDAQDDGDSGGPGDSQGDHQEGCNDQGRKGQPGDGVVRRSDDAAEIAGDGGEEESD